MRITRQVWFRRLREWSHTGPANVLSYAVIAIALGLIGVDFLTAASGAATAISNVGPGLGPTIGPSGTFATLSDGAKWILSAGMLLGRLELFTVVVLLLPSFWRD